MTITTQITFADLIAQYDDELDEYTAAYEETVELAEERHGENALDMPPSALDDEDDQQDLMMLQQTAQFLNESIKSDQKRQNVLAVIQEEYDSDGFTVKMMSGQELMEVETDLRMYAQSKDLQQSEVQHKRKGFVADTGTVDAPDDVPTDDSGSPVPSEAENAVMYSLYDMIEALNQGGSVDFRAEGYGDDTTLGPSSTSVAPTTSEPLSSASAGTDASTPDSGDDS